MFMLLLLYCIFPGVVFVIAFLFSFLAGVFLPPVCVDGLIQGNLSSGRKLRGKVFKEDTIGRFHTMGKVKLK